MHARIQNFGEFSVETGDPYLVGVFNKRIRKVKVKSFYNKMASYHKKGQYLWSGSILQQVPKQKQLGPLVSQLNRWGVYKSPKLASRFASTSTLKFVVGGNNSGLGLHFHEDGFNEVLRGVAWILCRGSCFCL